MLQLQKENQQLTKKNHDCQTQMEKLTIEKNLLQEIIQKVSLDYYIRICTNL